MRYEKGRKSETTRKILEVAGRRFRSDGMAATGMTGIMADAGLTNGGFYAHFSSKAALERAVVETMMKSQADVVEQAKAAGMTLEGMITAYLAPSHRDIPEEGCPSAALLPEIARQDDALRQVYSAHLDELLEIFTSLIGGDRGSARALATAIYTMMIGTLQLSRAVNDPALSEAILSAGRASAVSLLSTNDSRS